MGTYEAHINTVNQAHSFTFRALCVQSSLCYALAVYVCAKTRHFIAKQQKMLRILFFCCCFLLNCCTQYETLTRCCNHTQKRMKKNFKKTNSNQKGKSQNKYTETLYVTELRRRRIWLVDEKINFEIVSLGLLSFECIHWICCRHFSSKIDLFHSINTNRWQRKWLFL